MLNKDASFFASMFVAVLAFLSSFYVYTLYGLVGALITMGGGLIWVGLGYYFKHSKSE